MCVTSLGVALGRLMPDPRTDNARECPAVSRGAVGRAQLQLTDALVKLNNLLGAVTQDDF